MKKLPVVLPPNIVSECWNVYKMAVIQTHPNVEEWLASKRLDVFLDAENRPLYGEYGENGAMYPLSYFNDILQYHEVSIASPDDIVERVEREIDQDHYLVVDLNFTTLMGDTAHEAPYIHEILIYGYDEKRKVLYYGGAEEDELAYDVFQENFASVWELYRRDAKRRYWRRMWHFPVTSLSLRLDYHNDNACFDLLRKIEREWKSGTFTETRYTATGDIEKQCTCHTGIYALLYLRDQLIAMLGQSPSEQDRYNGMLTILKFCEHRAMLLKSMAWFINRNGFLEREDSAEPMRAAYARYERCVDEMTISRLNYMKYMETKNSATLQKVIDRLHVQYTLEYGALEQFLQTAKAFYH
ncbi:hypothetical protein [Bianquea renquensis]|uniref:Uncharacterized protein n=1 Tax=Bianquea renquensis TaxID=2763661 RepID=A0A926DNK0_9FIRM|nr:hypothetical protein [Bianquea renquensis]MBC8542275.1 hypothetical protein [Bianquea renquensis]